MNLISRPEMPCWEPYTKGLLPVYWKLGAGPEEGRDWVKQQGVGSWKLFQLHNFTPALTPLDSGDETCEAEGVRGRREQR